MIVRIKSKDGPNLFIPIPTGLFCNRLMAAIAAKTMEQNGWTATPPKMLKNWKVWKSGWKNSVLPWKVPVLSPTLLHCMISGFFWKCAVWQFLPRKSR